MNQTKTRHLNDVFGDKVATFFSDRSVDFVLKSDQADLTTAQKEYLSEQLGFPIPPIVNIRQVHGDRVIIASEEDLKSRGGPLPEADGIITNFSGIPIVVRTADCLPVFIFDPEKNCIGLVHAGWRGTAKQIALKAAQAMRDNWACSPQDLQILLGPAIRSCCYEVGPELKNFSSEEIVARDNKIFLDLILANRRQLLRYGVKPINIFDSEIYTCCDKSYFSYRREGQGTGRHISVIVLRST